MSIPLIIVLIYVLFLFALSFYVARSQKNDGDSFLMYKGQNGTLVTALTVAGLAIGGASTIGIAEKAYSSSYGLSAGWYDTAWAIGSLLCSLYIVKKLRHSKGATLTGMTAEIYGKGTTFLFVISTILLQCGIIAGQYSAGGTILSSLIPNVFSYEGNGIHIISHTEAGGGILGSGILIDGTFFSFILFMAIVLIGGMGSVSLSNLINIALIYIGMIIALLLVLFDKNNSLVAAATGGNANGFEVLQQFFAQPGTENYSSIYSGYGIAGILGWIILLVCTTNALQGVVQIGMSAKDDKAADNGYRLGAAMMVPIGFICALLGVAAVPLLNNPDISGGAAMTEVLLSLSPVVAGLTLAGVWAADMSTGCSMLMGCSTTVSKDVLKIKGEKALMKNKLVVLLVGVVTYLISTMFTSILSLLSMALTLSVGMAVIVLGGLLFPKFASRTAGFVTMCISVVGFAVWYICSMQGITALSDAFLGQSAFYELAICLIPFVLLSAVMKDKVADSQYKEKEHKEKDKKVYV